MTRKIVAIIVLVLWSINLYADDSTIKGLLKEIEIKVTAKNYQAIEKNIYPLSDKFNVNWIIGGIKKPTTVESEDNGFNLQALKKIEANDKRFMPLAKSSYYNDVKKAFLKSFKDDSPKASFINNLKNGANDIYILKNLDSRSMVLIFRNNNRYQLVWWKEMIRVAKQL